MADTDRAPGVDGRRVAELTALRPDGVARRRFLLAMWDGGGTVPPELGVARRLVERGHDVHVLADPTLQRWVGTTGCTFSPWRRAPHRTSPDPAHDPVRDWEVTDPLSLLRRVRDRLVVGPAPAVAADTDEAIAAVHPDVVLADGLLLGAMAAAQGVGLPVAALVPNIWMAPTPGTAPVGPGFRPARTALGRARDAALRWGVARLFDGALPVLDTVRAARGLSPLDSVWAQLLACDRVLVLSSGAFDVTAPRLPGHVRYTGPVLDDPDWVEAWQDPWEDGDDRPLVLVAFSSTFQDQAGTLRRVVDALSALDVRAVVTLGEALDAGAVDGTGDVVVVRSAPHRQLLTEASLVVTHGGHGTTMKALAAGVPLVCLPMGRDQPDTAARVVSHGAGVRLRPGASPARIGRAVAHVLRDPRHRAGAERLAAAIAWERAHADPVAELERLGRLHRG